ncbi:MAG: hypothetical protein JWN15_60, partial [Firmicutes bacterium]|nr:hypothetical protein [Bacillota bacterium]
HCDPEAPGALLAAVGVQYTLGFVVDWQLLYPTGGSHVALPAYPGSASGTGLQLHRPKRLYRPKRLHRLKQPNRLRRRTRPPA